MEIYAGFLEHTDHHVGRLVDALDDLEVLDDTLIYYIIGDNGASAEGTLNGCFNEMVILNGMAGLETPEFLRSKIDDFGAPDAYNHYAVGWAHAMCTPYQWTKQIASHWGGTRNGTIVHWPNGIDAKGEMRSQFHHVIDVAPTRAGRGRTARAGDRERHRAGAARGREHGLQLRRRRAPERHDVQYFEMFGNRGHLPPGLDRGDQAQHPVDDDPTPPFDEDVWELYGPDDWTQSNNLAAAEPGEAGRAAAAVADRGREVQRAAASTIAATSASTPTWPAGRSWSRATRQMLFGGMGRLTEGSIVSLKNKSHAVTAEVDGARRGRRGGDHRPGRQRRRLEPVRQGGQAEVLLQLLRHPAVLRRIERAHSRPGTTRCAWSSTTTAAAWPRAARCRCSSTASAVGQGRVERTDADGASPPTRPATSAATPARPSPPTTALTRQRLHRRDRLGANRHRRRRPRPPDLA